MSRLPDSDLEVLVDAAAEGAWNSKAAHAGGPQFAELERGRRNEIREAALPFIFHGTKALHDLGYVKPRTITTIEELDALGFQSVVRDAEDYVLERWGEPEEHMWATPMNGAWIRSAEVTLPATVLYEPEATA